MGRHANNIFIRYDNILYEYYNTVLRLHSASQNTIALYITLLHCSNIL